MDYKPTNSVHSDSPSVYTSDKVLNLSTLGKMHLNFDVIDGSVVNGIREPILFSFVLDKPSGYEVFCEPETIYYKKINISLLNTIATYFEVDNHE